MVDVRLPALGDTVGEARISTWLYNIGDLVEVDNPLVEVETDKVETALPSPVGGTLNEILVAAGQTAAVGDVIAVISPVAEGARAMTTPSVPPVAARVAEPARAPDVPTPISVRPTPSPSPLRGGDPRVRSPLVRALLRDHGVDPSVLGGTGNDGRITRDDVLSHLAATTNPPATPDESPGEWAKFPLVRRRTGERMMLSHTAIPMVTTMVRVDYERVQRVRAELSVGYKKRAGHSLTYLPFVAKATVDALLQFPHLNATLEGDGLRLHPAINLGIAVDLDRQGLVVPVVHDAQSLRLTALASRFAALAQQARSRNLSPASVSGGTFTITNPGGYGTFVGTPLINPPQVAILSVEGISKEAVVVEGPDGDALAIHHVGYLSLSWDHRAVDGIYAAAFLDCVRSILQSRDWAADIV